MCTCTIIGRDATEDGSVLLGANNDWDRTPGRLRYVPRMEHGRDESFRTVRGFEIPQAETTFAYHYTCCVYPIGHRSDAWAEGMNEHQVAVAQTGVHAFQPIDASGAALEADDIPWIILERAASARQAIELVGELVAQYGFNTSSWEGAEGVAVFAVADPKEGWWLELAPGHHWVAQRVPDDMASVRVNCLGIHDADLNDRENVLCSRGLAEYAAARGWGGEPAHFDFSGLYGRDKSINEWGPELDKLNMYRRWRAMSLYARRDLPEDELIYQVRPAKKLNVDDVKAVLRDVYAGTCHDLTTVPEAGPFGDPFHDGPCCYSLAQVGTVASMVAHLRSWLPDAFGGIMWVALSNPHTSFYFPIPAGAGRLPARFSQTKTMKGEDKSAWWIFKDVGLLTSRRYRPNMTLLSQIQQTFETDAAQRMSTMEDVLSALWPIDRTAAYALLDLFSVETASRALAAAEEAFAALELQY